MQQAPPGWKRASTISDGLLTRLGRSTSGNVMMMTAVGVIPLLAMIGGAVDASRIYMSYARLQQACDAGALAGRKAMANVTALTATEQAKANEFFDFNFPADTYSGRNITRSFAKGGDGVVVGTASVTMPTTIMKIFGYTTVPVSVTCQATLNIPNTDVMFVLDVTGSMGDTPSGDTQTKISGLRDAVKAFYSALGPGAASGPGRIRYGFVPYSMNVNVGRLLFDANPAFMMGGQGSETYSYQSRRANFVNENYILSYGTESTPAYGADSYAYGSWSDYSNNNAAVNGYPASYPDLKASECDAKTAPADRNVMNAFGAPTSTGQENVQYPDNEQTLSYSATQTGAQYDYMYARTTTTTKGTCYLRSRSRSITVTRPSTTTRSVQWAQRDRFTSWTYLQRDDIDVSPFVQSRDPVANPTLWNGYYTGSNPNGTAPTSFRWNGCVEEADTVNSITSGTPLAVPNGARDLEIDLVPNSRETRWRPLLRELVYRRAQSTTSATSGTWMGGSTCPPEARRLRSYTGDYNATTRSSADFNGYVDGLQVGGNTYHDIGLIWGARFLSPDGIFAPDNRDSSAPGGYQVSRHIVFMTDGALVTSNANYDPWGINMNDGRVAPTSASSSNTDASHQRRTEIICNEMKGKGYTIWVIGFGISTLSNTLRNCASDADHASVASNSTELRARFAQIAQTVGGLRLSS